MAADTSDGQFREAYGEYVEHTLLPAERDVRRALRRWLAPSYWEKYTTSVRAPSPAPVQDVRTRIKRPESVMDKIHRKSPDYPKGLAAESFLNMTDTLGGRAVLYFLSHIPLVDQDIRESDIFEISTQHPPVAYIRNGAAYPFELPTVATQIKDSGYMSVHYILRLKHGELAAEQQPWFELQVRTLVEHAWSEIEHVIGYKPSRQTSFAVTKTFRNLSILLEAVDHHFNFIYEELERFQAEAIYNDNTPLNPENLPAVLAELGISVSQKEIDGMLKVLISRHAAQTVGELRRIATKERIEHIRTVFQERTGLEPSGFEFVASLAEGFDSKNTAEFVSRIGSLIELLDSWERLRQVEPRSRLDSEAASDKKDSP